jgi:branched-chain amino acid transport system permease protein
LKNPTADLHQAAHLMDWLALSLLNGLSHGLLLFMLSAGLTLIYSLMGVLNFAHASFYMLGAYAAHSLSPILGFWGALLVAPFLVGVLGAWFEEGVLRRVHAQGHVAELLVTFGLAYVAFELVQLVWGKGPVAMVLPDSLQGHWLTPWGTQFPVFRVVMMGMAVAMLLVLAWFWRRTHWGLVVRAAVTHPQAVQALGHNVPQVYRWVFGVGAALAAAAGVMGGHAFVTEPGMAATMGSVVFVVLVVGGVGSLAGAFAASMGLGLLQALAIAAPWSLWGWPLSQFAPILPFALMVLVLIWRPQGLMGDRHA